MKMIDEFEAAHMTDAQFIRECWEQGFLYHDYVTNCDLLERAPVSKQTFHSLYKTHEVQAIVRKMR
jgi:hypothetical protein